MAPRNSTPVELPNKREVSIAGRALKKGHVSASATRTMAGRIESEPHTHAVCKAITVQ
jgi:hypothetical protein